jgi:hypothetical protein
MADPVQVEITLSVRHRDKDFNIVGSGVTRTLVVELDEFNTAVKEYWPPEMGGRPKTTTRASRQMLSLAAMYRIAQMLHIPEDRVGKKP